MVVKGARGGGTTGIGPLIYGNVGAVSIDRRFLAVSTQRARQVCTDTEMLCRACWKAMVGLKGQLADVCSFRKLEYLSIKRE